MRPPGDEDEAVLAEGLATVPDNPFAFCVRGGGAEEEMGKKEGIMTVYVAELKNTINKRG